MSDVMLFAYLFSGIWCGVGLIFLIIGLLMRYNKMSKVRECIAVTVGNVTGIDARNNHSEGGKSNHPVFEYYVDGQNFRQVSNVGGSKIKLKVGQSVTIHYSPKNPKKYYVEEYALGNLLHRIFMAVGGVCILIGIVAFACCLKLI